MIDIHSHILFGLDDGAQTIEETKMMLEYACRDGIRKIIATPHFVKTDQDHAKVQENFEEIVRWLESSALPIQILMGHEAVLQDSLIEDLEQGNCRTLAGSRYVLVEFYTHTPTYIVKQLIFQIGLKGYVPVLAHGERLVENKYDLNKLIALREMGCLIQINARTILKPVNRWQKKWVYRLLKQRKISFIASDAHNMTSRTPELKSAYKLIARKIGKSIAEDIFNKYPNQLILDEDIS